MKPLHHIPGETGRERPAIFGHAAVGEQPFSGFDASVFGDFSDILGGLSSSRIDRTIAFVQGFEPQRFEGAEARKVTVTMRGEPVEYVGLPYLAHAVLPNFFFHATTAYDILRHAGVELGKRDFIGTV